MPQHGDRLFRKELGERMRLVRGCLCPNPLGMLASFAPLVKADEDVVRRASILIAVAVAFEWRDTRRHHVPTVRVYNKGRRMGMRRKLSKQHTSQACAVMKKAGEGHVPQPPIPVFIRQKK